MTTIELETYSYLGRVYVNTHESLATNVADSNPGIYSAWQAEYEPALDIRDLPISLSELDWVEVGEERKCIDLEE